MARLSSPTGAGGGGSLAVDSSSMIIEAAFGLAPPSPPAPPLGGSWFCGGGCGGGLSAAAAAVASRMRIRARKESLEGEGALEVAGVGGRRLGDVQGDGSGLVQLGEVLIEALRPVHVAVLGQVVGDLVGALGIGDVFLDGLGGDHDLRRDDASLALRFGEEALADGSLEVLGETVPQRLLRVGGEGVAETADGLRRVGSVDRGEHQVACLRGLERDVDG